MATPRRRTKRVREGERRCPVALESKECLGCQILLRK